MCFAASNQSAFLKHSIFKLCKKLFMKSATEALFFKTHQQVSDDPDHLRRVLRQND